MNRYIYINPKTHKVAKDIGFLDYIDDLPNKVKEEKEMFEEERQRNRAMQTWLIAHTPGAIAGTRGGRI